MTCLNVPKIYEIISLDDKLIVIEEYINGSSLKEILAESKIISGAKVIEYILSLINIPEAIRDQLTSEYGEKFTK